MHDLAELDLQIARQIEAVIGLENVGDAALPRLAVDAHDRFIRAADVLRVDRQIRHFPHGAVGGRAVRGEAFLDRVLVRTGEGGEYELAAVGMALVHGQAIAVLDRLHDAGDVAQIELGIDALRK